MHKVWITGIGILSALGSGQKSHCSAMADSRTGLIRCDALHDGQPVSCQNDSCRCGIIPSKYYGPAIEDDKNKRGSFILEHTINQVLRYAEQIPPLSVDLIIGTALNTTENESRQVRDMRIEHEMDPHLASIYSPWLLVEKCIKKYSIKDAVSTPFVAMYTSSATAIAKAFHRIRSGESQRIIAGGFEALSPSNVTQLRSAGVISTKECKPFDIQRDGFNPGEGAALLFMESEESTRERNAKPLAEISGFGEDISRSRSTPSQPKTKNLVKAIKKAMELAQITKDGIDYIHLQGMATHQGDILEYSACKTVFGRCLKEIPVCSTKPMTGHTFGTSAAMNAVFSTISIQNSIVPATLFHQTIDPAMPDLCILKKPQIIYGIQHVLSLSYDIQGEASAIVISRIKT